MANRTLPNKPLAYETHGEGIPVVFLHGLNFDRRSWGPIITRLGAGVRSIAIDLPGHGRSPGPACGLEQLAGRIAHTLDTIGGIDAPIVVGHSMSGALAMIYAGAHPVCGVVDVDQPWNIRPFVELVQQAAPMLRSERFLQRVQHVRAHHGLGPVVARSPSRRRCEPARRQRRRTRLLG